jgi:hypothetical protein
MTPRIRALACALLLVPSVILRAHSGPPFPIVSDRPAGPYLISIWTDPDTTDDGSPGGQFWVRVQRHAEAGAIPAQTRATVAIKPLDRTGPELTGSATPVHGDITNQFAGLVMDHEGRFAVHVTIDGPLGAAAVDTAVDATYDLRPPPFLLAVYLLPFLLVGLLWGRLLVRRRAAQKK